MHLCRQAWMFEGFLPPALQQVSKAPSYFTCSSSLFLHLCCAADAPSQDHSGIPLKLLLVLKLYCQHLPELLLLVSRTCQNSAIASYQLTLSHAQLWIRKKTVLQLDTALESLHSLLYNRRLKTCIPAYTYKAHKKKNNNKKKNLVKLVLVSVDGNNFRSATQHSAITKTEVTDCTCKQQDPDWHTTSALFPYTTSPS